MKILDNFAQIRQPAFKYNTDAEYSEFFLDTAIFHNTIMSQISADIIDKLTPRNRTPQEDWHLHTIVEGKKLNVFTWEYNFFG